MRFVLVRHGQTDWNLSKRVQGQTDLPLNETGIMQAGLLAGSLKKLPIRLIFSSCLMRAKETAEILRDEINRTGKNLPEVIPMEDLAEVAFGEWEGKTLAQIAELYPEDYERWVRDPAWQTPTGGESRESLRGRTARVIDGICAREDLTDDSTVAIVAHGGILVYVIAYLLRAETERREIIVENASITTVDYDRKTGAGHLVRMNDTDHLEGGMKTPWKPDLRK